MLESMDDGRLASCVPVYAHSLTCRRSVAALMTGCLQLAVQNAECVYRSDWVQPTFNSGDNVTHAQHAAQGEHEFIDDGPVTIIHTKRLHRSTLTSSGTALESLWATAEHVPDRICHLNGSELDMQRYTLCM